MRTISNTAIHSINAPETSEVWLPMVVLSHNLWTEDVRLVRNTENMTHGGETFLAFPFDISLPDEEFEKTSVLQFVASNVSRELVWLMRQTSGPISGSVFWVLASAPDDIEIGPFDLEIRGFEYDAHTISGAMQVEPVLDSVFGTKNMDTKNAPGIF